MVAVMNERAIVSDINREQLIARMNGSGDHPARITAVSAPRGYGKSTLLSQWMQTADRSGKTYVFLSAAGLPDEESFWQALGDRLQLDFGEVSQADIRSPGAQQIFEWAQNLLTPTVLVIDDYQDVTTPSLDSDMSELLVAAPKLSLLVAGRSFRGLTGPLATARHTTNVLNAEQLALTTAEVERALEGCSGVDSTRVLQDIEETGGWPVAAELICRDASSGMAFGDIGVHPQEVLYSFLRSEREKELATLIAALPGANVTLLAGALETEPENISQAIRPLLESGLIYRDPSISQARYLCVPYMRDYLLERADQFWYREDLAELRVRHAADLALSDPEASLSLLLQAGHFRRAEDVVVENLETFFTKWNLTLPILRRMDNRQRAAYPILTGFRLLLEMAAHDRSDYIEEALTADLLEAANHRLRAGNADHDLATQVFLVVALRRSGKWQEALDQIRDLRNRITCAAGRESDAPRAVRFLCGLVAGQTAALAGETQLAKEFFIKALETEQGVNSPLAELNALAGLALVNALEADTETAKRYLDTYDRMVADVPVEEVPWPVKVNRTLAGAIVAGATGRILEERAALAALGSQLAGEEQWPFYALIEAALLRQEEGPYPALKQLAMRYKSSSRERPLPPILEGQILCELADLATFCGRYTEAEQILKHVAPNNPLRLNSAARRHLFRQEPDQALEALRAQPEAPPGTRIEQERLLLASLAAYEIGQFDLAAGSFSEYAVRGADLPNQWDLTRVPHGMLQKVAALTRDRGMADLTARVEQIPAGWRADQEVSLSVAETRVFSRLAEGLSNPEIAAALSRSENTVKSHLQSAFRKLRVDDRQQAIMKAARYGLLEPSPVLEAVTAAPARKGVAR